MAQKEKSRAGSSPDKPRASGRSAANVTHHLQGIDFPATKEDMLKIAKQKGADKDLIDTIKKMPDKEYVNMADVMKGYGQSH